ncbi:uncharacterized protein LOC143739179 [Siphateles boraxobius]|uniref:uncharacterized protein LOC143739179 n=1 Tax=Siphateles boraxobius TaxID=180520 RepID=UPI0040631476
MPPLESTCCSNCHRLLQRIAILETKLIAGPPNQTEHTTELRHGRPQHTAGESHESSASRQAILSVEKQADRFTNRWHKQGARPKGTRDIRLSRASHITAVASSTPDTALTRTANTGLLPPPIHLENRFEVLMNEESPNLMNVIEHRLNQPVANTDANWGSRSSRQRHSAHSAAEPRTLIVGDSVIRNINSRDTTTCCLPQATTSDVNRELQNILMKHKTANRLIIHVGKNDIHKEQSELLKKDFNELFETLKRLKVQTFISGPLPARGTNRFSRLLGLNTWLQKTCNIKGVNFIDNFNLFWSQRQLFQQDGHHPNKLGSRVLKDNIYFSLRHPSAMCANPLNLNGTHTPGYSMNDHRISLQPLNGHAVDTSHKDSDNTTQPQQPLLTDTISAEPCPQSSPQTDCDIPALLQYTAPKDDFLENSQGNQDSILQPPITPEQKSLSLETLSLSPASPLLCFSEKMEQLVHAGTRLSHSFAASPQIPTKKRQAPQPPKPTGPARPPPPPVRALRPLPQRQGPHPPPAAREQAGTQCACMFFYCCSIT